jgi:hypothetical protein
MLRISPSIISLCPHHFTGCANIWFFNFDWIITIFYFIFCHVCSTW